MDAWLAVVEPVRSLLVLFSFSPCLRALRDGNRSCAPGGTSGFCFPPVGGRWRVYGSSKNRCRAILGTSSKSNPRPREQGPARLRVPLKQGQKEENKMKETRTD